MLPHLHQLVMQHGASDDARLSSGYIDHRYALISTIYDDVPAAKRCLLPKSSTV